MVGVPEEIECPCGNGHAERLPKPTGVKPYVGRRQVVHSYRHSGCHVGGQIVVKGNTIIRRAGPLFHPDRFRIPPFDTDMVRVATDGGEVVEE